MDLDAKLSCEGFPSGSTSSDKNKFDYPCQKTEKPPPAEPVPTEPKDMCFDMLLTSSSSTTASTLTSGILDQVCHPTKMPPYEPPNIRYELDLAKSIMQQFSTISGDNLFDHLTDIIKRVIDERPPNVIDFFEEFSRSVREQKFHYPERFPPDAIYEEGRMFKVAKKQLISMQLPYPRDETYQPIGDEEEEERVDHMEQLKLDIHVRPMSIFHIFNERIQMMQFFWNQCGFSISNDDIFQLACAMSRLQTHPSILQCRFWGMINGLKASYYIVEAYLTNDELDCRLLQMEKEIRERFLTTDDSKNEDMKTLLPSYIGPELKPGAVGWENWPVDELEKMKPDAAEVPLPKSIETYDIPPEPMGMGINRYTYFVVNSLTDEWIELPIVTPKQIVISRQIKKFITGNLENDVVSYPCFPGKEKHYLRAIIGRITAGTYIAPKGYYRKMTKRERRLFEGMNDDEMEEEQEDDDDDDEKFMNEGEEEEMEEPDNDVVLLKNEKWKCPALKTLSDTYKWVHTRPNILKQGRVVWFDEEKALRDREKERKRLEKLRLMEEAGELEDEEDDDEEIDEDEGDESYIEGLNREIGPPILSPCSNDISEETTAPWVQRYTSKFTNENERILLMQSNIWPGAYTFIYQDLCESIYLGWGIKYVSRNMPWIHLPPIAQEYPHNTGDFIEADDPTVEMEEAYRLSLLRKEFTLKNLDEHLSEYEIETHESEDEDADEEEEE